jgi:hypothetical protein
MGCYLFRQGADRCQTTSFATRVPGIKRRAIFGKIRLLADLRIVFGDASEMPSKVILAALSALPESPWGDVRGKPLDERGLANRLRQYGVKPKTVRIGQSTPRGYVRADLVEQWSRYLSAQSAKGETSKTSKTDQESQSDNVADVLDVAPVAANGGDPDPDGWSFNTEPQDDLSIPEYLKRT